MIWTEVYAIILLINQSIKPSFFPWGSNPHSSNVKDSLLWYIYAPHQKIQLPKKISISWKNTAFLVVPMRPIRLPCQNQDLHTETYTDKRNKRRMVKILFLFDISWDPLIQFHIIHKQCVFWSFFSFAWGNLFVYCSAEKHPNRKGT